MRPDELHGLAVECVPGRGPPVIGRLRGGQANETYRVRRDGVDYALRLPLAQSAELGLDRAWEIRVMDTAAAAGLAPALVFRDARRGILVSRWIEGRTWDAAEVRGATHVTRMADLLRALHGLPPPAPPRAMNPGEWIEHYQRALRRSAIRGEDTGSCAAAALRTGALAQLAALAQMPAVPAVVCHSDLHTLNLIDRGRDLGLVLLDWEYAHAGDPLWDLAGWSANNDFSEAPRRELLRRYAGRAPTAAQWIRLGLLCWLYDYVCLLWSELYLRLRSRDAQDGEADGGRGERPAAGRRDPQTAGIAERSRLLAARLAATLG